MLAYTYTYNKQTKIDNLFQNNKTSHKIWQSRKLSFQTMKPRLICCLILLLSGSHQTQQQTSRTLQGCTPQPVIKQLNHFATYRQTASSLPCPQPLLQLTECHWPSAKLPVDASLFSCPLKENTTSTLPFRSCTAKYTVWSALVSRPNRPSSKKVRNSNVMLKLREKKEKEAKVYCTLSLHHTCSSQRCILALSFKQQVTEPM